MTSDVLSEFAKGETATASDKAGDGPTPLIVEAVTILVSEIAAYTARIEAIAAEAYTPGSPLWPATADLLRSSGRTNEGPHCAR